MNEQEERAMMSAILRLPCEDCKATPGAPCSTFGGNKRKNFHERRMWPVVQAWFKERDAKQGIHKCPMCGGKGKITVTKDDPEMR